MQQAMWPILPTETGHRIDGREKHRLRRLARVGHAAKGCVHLLIGLLAAGAAWGGGRAPGAEDSLRTLAEGAVGAVLLSTLTIGLVAYAFWQLYSAVKGANHQRASERVAQFITGAAYGGLAIEAGRLALSVPFGTHAPATGPEVQHWTAQLMSYPLGQWIVGAVGLMLIGYAISQFRTAWRGPVDRELDLEAMRRESRALAERLGRTGVGARSVALALVGAFLLVAAIQSDPSEARGLGGALRALAAQPFGPWFLAAIAIGLVADGVFQFVKAKFPRVILRRA